jgi:chemotaxis protein histidine kinase CheA
MPDQSVPPLDAFQAQLKSVLDQQLAVLKSHYDEEIAQARRQAAAEAERQLSARLEDVRLEWTKRLESEVAAAGTAAEKKAAEAAEAHAQQRVEQALSSAKRTAELEIASERRRAQNELEAERKRLQQEADAERQRAEREVVAVRQRAEQEVAAVRMKLGAELDAAKAAAARASEAAQRSQTAAPVDARAFDRVTGALQEIDAAGSLTQTLDAALKHTAALSGRAALFFINGDRLKPWKGAGVPDGDLQTVESSIDARDLLARAIQTGQATRSSAELPIPPFARLDGDRVSAAVPLIVGGRAVAVLYADNGGEKPEAAETWLPLVDAVARHASAVLALQTATRTLELFGGGGNGAAAGGTESVDDQSARRYARLLVSEIKLYNEGAVRAGRQQRDLLQRLRSEIDRARRLYEERVPPSVGARHMYFQQELVHTLADGDPALLGSA